MGSSDFIKVIKGGVAARILDAESHQDLNKIYSEQNSEQSEVCASSSGNQLRLLVN